MVILAVLYSLRDKYYIMKRTFLFLLILISVCFVRTTVYAQMSNQYVDSVYKLGLRYMEAFNFKDAVKCFYDCQRERHDNPVYHYVLGQAYEQMGNIQDARLFYQKAYSLDSLEVRYLMSLGNIEMQRRDYEAARVYYESMVLLDSTNAYYHKQLGKSCYYGHELACALESFSKSLYYNNRDLETTGLMARIYYDNEHYDACMEWLTKGLRLDADNPGLLHLKLRCKVKTEEYEEAIMTAERIFETGDSSYQVQKFYGIALNKTGEYEKSIAIMAPLVEIKGDEGLHYYLGDSYAETGEPNKSIEHMEAAAYEFGIGPMVWRYFHKLSRLYSETGNTKSALRYMERAYDLHPDPLILYQLARLTDTYYLDKQMAMNRYNQYLATDDTLFRDYAEERILELKRYLHQSSVK